MKFAIYCRVSTEDQTLDQQRNACIRRCESDGHTYEIYEEKISGAKETRPQLDYMLQDIRKRKLDGVMVWKLDRLGRSSIHLMQLIAEFNNKGVPFISLTEGFDTSTSMGRFTCTILAAMAQMERENISERVKLKQAYLRSKGVHIGRPKGAKDLKPRRKAGYNVRWSGGRSKNPWGKNPVSNKKQDDDSESVHSGTKEV